MQGEAPDYRCLPSGMRFAIGNMRHSADALHYQENPEETSDPFPTFPDAAGARNSGSDLIKQYWGIK